MDKLEAEIVPLSPEAVERCECGDVAESFALIGSVRVLCCNSYGCRIAAKQEAFEEYIGQS